MTALDRIAKLPDWPARMTAPVAAAYMGISEGTFLSRFGDRGVKEGANKLWARVQLDLIIAQQFGLEAESIASEYDRWNTGRSAQDDTWADLK